MTSFSQLFEGLLVVCTIAVSAREEDSLRFVEHPLDIDDFFYRDLIRSDALKRRDVFNADETETSFFPFDLFHSAAMSPGRSKRQPIHNHDEASDRLTKAGGPNLPWQEDIEDLYREHPGQENENEEEDRTIDIDEAVLATQQQNEADFHAFWSVDANADTIRQRQARIMTSYIDPATDPCVDFYAYACGNWASHNPIPQDKNGYGTFEMLRESLDKVLKEILQEPVDSALTDIQTDATVKAKHLYQSCMDYDILRERAEKPLLKLLDDFGGWPFLRPDWNGSQFDWQATVAQLRLYNNGVLVAVRVGPDINNSDEYIIQLDQTSLGLLTREDFLQPSNQMYLAAYRNYVIQIATLLGAPLENATTDAEEMIDFEMKLAKMTSAPDERRNISDLCQRMTVSELSRAIPQVDWYVYLSTVLNKQIARDERVVVFAMKYFQELMKLMDVTPIRTVSNYLLWRFVQHRINNLDDRYQEANQRFDYILFGREKVPPRWKSCVTQVNSNMGMALGAMFVRSYFDEFSKNDATHMTEAIMHSFRELLDLTTWIDDDTKRFAFLKVDAMLLRIGYPDFILDSDKLNHKYKDVTILPGKYFENTLNILRHRTRIEQQHIRDRVVNKTQWDTAPTVVNGYYSRNKNQIMFPACILQPPFYHRFFPKSLNFGGIGVVIGHEVTHGFDDKGRLFDQNGNLHRWWSDDSIDRFHTRAKCLIDQYSHYVVKEVNMLVDGVNTQGENIADNGGIKQAFRAFHRWMELHGAEGESLPGLDATPDQMFFLNFAQVWCSSTRPETARNNLKTAVHAPGKYRVIGTLSNSEDFAEAFNCSVGTPMNPEVKCNVW